MMTDDPPRWGDHHGWQRGDQRDDGGTDFLWCRCHQGLAAHPKSCKIAAIAPQIDVEHAKMRGYILASFFFSGFYCLYFSTFSISFFGAIKIMAAGCWMLGITRWALARAVCAPLASKQARKTPLDPGIRDRDGIKTSKKLQTMVCMCIYICI